MKSIGERVQAGAQYLDEVVPDWAERINTDTLDVGRGFLCPLAQAMGDTFTNVVAKTELRTQFLADNGFYSYSKMVSQERLCIVRAWSECNELTEAWVSEIVRRRELLMLHTIQLAIPPRLESKHERELEPA